MAKRTYTVDTCDWPGCPTEGEDIERCVAGIGVEVTRPELCSEHRRALRELLDNLPGGRKPRRRGIRVVNPEDIPRAK